MRILLGKLCATVAHTTSSILLTFVKKNFYKIQLSWDHIHFGTKVAELRSRQRVVGLQSLTDVFSSSRNFGDSWLQLKENICLKSTEKAKTIYPYSK